MKTKSKFTLITVLLFLTSTLAACGSNENEMSVKKPYVQPEMKGEISVNVYNSSEWLETASKLFVDKYPDVKVNINVFFQGTDTMITENGGSTMSPRPAGQTREDYIVQLNTQLLSQKADDIVITSVGLPLGRYAKMGVFEDLTYYLDAAEEINETNYYKNVFDAYRTEEGKLYQMPISAMAIPLVCFDKELQENTGIKIPGDKKAVTWREALDIGIEMYDASSLPNTFMPEAKSIVADVYTKAVVASVDYEAGEVELDREQMETILEVFEEMEYFQTSNPNSEYHIPFSINYTPDTDAAFRAVKNGYQTLQWKQDDGNVYLSPYYALDFGITKQSSKKELAWEFLRFLISEEVQTLPSCPYSGVNKKGLEARVKGYAKMQGCSEKEGQQMADIIDNCVSQITAYRAEDTDLIQISEGTLNEFMNGNADAEQTIDTLIRRLEQYMNE